MRGSPPGGTCDVPEGINHSGARVLLRTPALNPAPRVPFPRGARYEYERLRLMSLLNPYLSASTSSPAPLLKPNSVNGVLILKIIVEGAPGNPTHCCRVMAVAHIRPLMPEKPGLKVW